MRSGMTQASSTSRSAEPDECRLCDEPAFNRKHQLCRRCENKIRQWSRNNSVEFSKAIALRENGHTPSPGRRPAEYSAATVRRALSTGSAPKCLTMASGEATLGRKGTGAYVSTSFGPAMRQVALRSAKAVVNSTRAGTASNKRGAKPQKDQQDCTACRTGAHGKEHLHSQHVKPSERAAKLEIRPASSDHFTTNVQTWGIACSPTLVQGQGCACKTAGSSAPRRMLKGSSGPPTPEPSDLRIDHDPMLVRSEIVQARLHGFEAYEDLSGAA
jgi:hypothetical protein